MNNKISINRITWIGLAINIFLALFKFVIGIIGKSQAVIADAFHTVSDTVTDCGILFGVRFWDAPADNNHHYGHRRIQTLITFGIGISLGIAGVVIGWESLHNIREIHISQPGWIALAAPLLSIVFKEILYHYTIKIGNETKSAAVIANAWHHRSDALSSFPVVVSVILSAINPKWAYFDHIGAFIVSLFIIRVSWKIIKPELLELTDYAASEKDREKIESIIKNVAEVRSINNIRTRKMGYFILLDINISVDSLLTIKDGHIICVKVKEELMSNHPDIIDAVIHLEPYECFEKV